jgi:hypothetical protein
LLFGNERIFEVIERVIEGERLYNAQEKKYRAEDERAMH